MQHQYFYTPEHKCDKNQILFIFLPFPFYPVTGIFLPPQSFFMKTRADVSCVLLLNIQRDSEWNAKGQMWQLRDYLYPPLSSGRWILLSRCGLCFCAAVRNVALLFIFTVRGTVFTHVGSIAFHQCSHCTRDPKQGLGLVFIVTSVLNNFSM